MPSSKYNTVAAAEKIDVLKRYDAENMKLLSQRKAAAKLGIKTTTLNRWLNSRERLAKTANSCDGKRKRYREGKCPEVDEALMLWFTEASLADEYISRTMLIRKAREIAKELSVDFRASDGWLTRWKERFDIVRKKSDGKEEKTFSEETVGERWLRHTWQRVLDKYSLKRIYNIDETAIYYKATPVDPIGHRKSKERLVVLLACNLAGTDKLMPLVVGRLDKKKCMKGIRHLPVDYRSNRNSFMTRPIFLDFLKILNASLKSKIAMLLNDNVGQPVLKLEKIELIFVPPSANNIGLPLQQGVIRSWKTYYRNLMKKRIAKAIEANPRLTVCQAADQLTVLDGLEMIAEAWSKVPSSYIASCFNEELNIVEPDDDANLDDEMSVWLNMDDELDTRRSNSSAIEHDKADEQSPKVTELVTREQMEDAMTILWRFMTQRREGGEFDILFKLGKLMDKSFRNINKAQIRLTNYRIS